MHVLPAELVLMSVLLTRHYMWSRIRPNIKLLVLMNALNAMPAKIVVPKARLKKPKTEDGLLFYQSILCSFLGIPTGVGVSFLFVHHPEV